MYIMQVLGFTCICQALAGIARQKFIAKIYRKDMKNKAYQQICLATEACSETFTLLLVLKYALWQDLKSCGGEKSTRRFWGLPAKIMLVRKTV